MKVPLMLLVAAIATCLPAVAQPRGERLSTPESMSESFESGQPDGWEIAPGAAIAFEGRNHFLCFSGPGHAFWIAARTEGLELRLRYRPVRDSGAEIICMASGEPPRNNAYVIRFGEGRAQVIRIGNGRERALGDGRAQLPEGTWSDICIQIAEGRIAILVGGTVVAQGTDASPVRQPGVLGLGCMSGEGIGFDEFRVSMACPLAKGWVSS